MELVLPRNLVLQITNIMFTVDRQTMRPVASNRASVVPVRGGATTNETEFPGASVQVRVGPGRT